MIPTFTLGGAVGRVIKTKTLIPEQLARYICGLSEDVKTMRTIRSWCVRWPHANLQTLLLGGICLWTIFSELRKPSVESALTHLSFFILMLFLTACRFSDENEMWFHPPDDADSHQPCGDTRPAACFASVIWAVWWFDSNTPEVGQTNCWSVLPTLLKRNLFLKSQTNLGNHVTHSLTEDDFFMSCFQNTSRWIHSYRDVFSVFVIWHRGHKMETGPVTVKLFLGGSNFK